MDEGLLIPISLFAAIFGIVYIYFMTRNRERMALIEKGASADLFNRPLKATKFWLKLGIMFIGIGLGIVIANLFVSAHILAEEVAFPSMIFIFAGAGLVASHYIAGSKAEEES